MRIARLQHTPAAAACGAAARSTTRSRWPGCAFPNRVGLAAGLDKNGRCIDGLGAMGFGFIEVGTVTPRPQPGNPKPRMFRLPEREGADQPAGLQQRRAGRLHRQRAARAQLSRARRRARPEHRQERRHADRARGRRLPAGLDGVYPHADYVTVNISSPNTQNLRELQSDAALDALLSAPDGARDAELAREHGRSVPMFVKIAPDLDDAQVARDRRDAASATASTA